MVVRRRRNDQRIVYMVAGGVIVALLLIMLTVLLVRSDGSSAAALEELASASASRDAGPSAPDAWAHQGLVAIQRVQRARTQREGAPTVGEVVAAGALQGSVALYTQLGVTDGEWVHRRVPGRSLYWVTWQSTYHGINFGPRWLVQLDADGPSPAGSGGVIPANALAELLHRADADRYVRYLNRSEQVLNALIDHRFEGGVRLASALLIYFGGRERGAAATELIGWAVIPRRVEVGGEVLYDAFFQWREDDRPRVAHFQVNLQNNQFEPRNLLANRIVADAGGISAESFVDIRPQSLDLSMDPRRERTPHVRALRYLLAREQMVEAVGALLSFRARRAAFTYTGWNIEPAGCTTCTISYGFTEDGEAGSVQWTVTSEGRIDAMPGIAMMAQQALSITRPAAEQDDARAQAGTEEQDDDATATP